MRSMKLLLTPGLLLLLGVAALPCVGFENGRGGDAVDGGDRGHRLTLDLGVEDSYPADTEWRSGLLLPVPSNGQVVLAPSIVETGPVVPLVDKELVAAVEADDPDRLPGVDPESARLDRNPKVGILGLRLERLDLDLSESTRTISASFGWSF